MLDRAGLIATIRARAEGATVPFIVALDGPSGAGKSTLARAIAPEFRASRVEGDDFYSGGTELVPRPPSHLADVCIDWRKLRAVLETLKLGREVRFAPFDWAAFDGSLAEEPRVIEARPVVLLEGVYAARPEFGDLVDLRVLVETPAYERERRLVAREGRIGDWERQWHRAEDWYFEHRMPRDAFDLVVSA